MNGTVTIRYIVFVLYFLFGMRLKAGRMFGIIVAPEFNPVRKSFKKIGAREKISRAGTLPVSLTCVLFDNISFQYSFVCNKAS